MTNKIILEISREEQQTFNSEVYKLAEIFFNVENQKQLPDQDWIKLNQSAQKSGKKMYGLLINNLFKKC